VGNFFSVFPVKTLGILLKGKISESAAFEKSSEEMFFVIAVEIFDQELFLQLNYTHTGFRTLG